MRLKKKTCTGGCGLEKTIWKNHNGLRFCKYCWAVYQVENDFPKQLKKTAYIKPISDKRQEELKIYRKKRDQYFKENPVCEFPGCSSVEITLHHRAGRTGSLFIDERYFCSLCMTHHRWVEENPNEAKKLGLSLSRLQTI